MNHKKESFKSRILQKYSIRLVHFYSSTCINLRGKVLPAKHFQASVFSGFMSWLHLCSWLSNQNYAWHFYFNWNWTKNSFHCFKDKFLFPKQLFPSWSLNESRWYDAFFPSQMVCFCLDARTATSDAPEHEHLKMRALQLIYTFMRGILQS